VAVVNPRRSDCAYPFKSLAGVGVTFKLVEALFRGRGSLYHASRYLDVVALGTIADAVPLVGENRVLVREGLERLDRFTRPGLRALLDTIGLGGRRVSAGQVAFQVAPRLNAAGRIGSAEQSLRLLFATDPAEARACAEGLDNDNTRRRTLDEAAGREAAERVETELGWPDCASILLWSESWHPGILGIVASRLVERFHRPAILVGLDGDRGRGSCRSVAGLDLTRVLSECHGLLESWGGHAYAAGLTVRRDRLPELRARVESVVRERLDPEACVPSLRIDADVTLSECDIDLVEWVERLAPHGLDNAEPVFRVGEVAVDEVSRVGQGRHLRLRVRDGTGDAEAIGFGYAAHAEEILRSGRCALAFAPGRMDYMGETRVQLRLRGVRAL
jgi:single-stranded-DNA-specific exonuclease